MRRAVLVFTFLILSGCARAGSPGLSSLVSSSAAPIPPQAMAKAQLETPNSLAILRQSAGGGQIIVKCDLDGESKLCLVDTGAQLSQVRADDPLIQQYPNLGSDFDNSIDGRAAGSFDLINIASLSVLGSTIHDVHFARERDDSFPDGLIKDGISGVIANDIFSRYPVHFDFPHREIHFNEAAPSSVRTQELTVLPSHHALMPIEVDGAQAAGLWDTGSFITVVDEQFVTDHPASFTDPKESDFSIEDGTGKKIQMKLYHVQNLKIGSLTIPDLVVGAVPLAQFNSHIAKPVQFLIGYNAIVRHDWYLDFPNKTWSVE